MSLKLVPEKDTLRTSPWVKGEGLAFCKLYNMDCTVFNGCPRAKLEEANKELRKLGFCIKVGIELEFQVFKQVNGKLETVENNLYNNANSLDLLGSDLEVIYF